MDFEVLQLHFLIINTFENTVIWGRWAVREQGQGECGELWRVCVRAVKALWALHWGPPDAMEH